ncbi:MAG: hypothetical protein PHF84_05080 [bacterium]|nr:hypothetical protein [bacterium]
MKKILNPIWIFILLLLPAGLAAGSYYYRDTFTTLSTFWSNEFDMGKDLIRIPQAENSRQYATNGRLIIKGCPNNDGGTPDSIYNGIFVGECVRNEKIWSASETQPFGFEIIRKKSLLNCHNSSGYGELPDRGWVDAGIWLAVDNGARALNEAFYDYVYFADHLRVSQTNEHASRIGYFDGVQHDFMNMGAVTNFFGNVINLTNNSIHSLRWDYRPRDQNSPNCVSNTNSIGFRITHNGSRIDFYVNPDPDNNDAYPSEWLKIGSKDVLWNTGMKIMVGHHVRIMLTRQQTAHFDELLVRSTTDKSKASISPELVPVSPEPQKLVYTISNSIKPENAGINVIRITKPAICRWATGPVDDIVVKDYYKDDPGEQVLRTVPVNPGEYPADDQVGVMTDGNKITLLLGSQITHKSRPERENIKVEFNFIIAQKFESGEFTSTIEAVQMERMPLAKKGRYSTCGEQRTEEKVIIRPLRQMLMDGTHAYGPFFPGGELTGSPETAFRTVGPFLDLKPCAVKGFEAQKEF